MVDHNHEEQSPTGNPPATLSKRDRVRFLTHELKASVRDKFHHNDEPKSPVEDDLFEDPAFDPQGVLKGQQAPHPSSGEDTKPSAGDRFTTGAKKLGNAISNPKAASRNNYTRHAATKMANHPHEASTALDEELLNAHDALTAAHDTPLTTRNDGLDLQHSNDSTIPEAKSRVQRVEQRRADLKSGWILGRQVMRVRAIRPVVAKPQPSQFVSEERHATYMNEPDRPPQVQWARYLGYLLLWYTQSFTAQAIDDYDAPPFDLRELMLTIERVVAITTPWQTLYSEFQDVYLWTDTSYTLKIMLGYWALWYFQQLWTFTIGYIIYITISNKIYNTTVERTRQRIARSRDQEATVREWAELIQKHGGNDWIEPLLDGIGPHLQLQLTDLTTFLEKLQNFYRWERPQQTWTTLGFFVCCFLFSIFSSMQVFSMMFELVLGCYFFYSCPIAAHYPKYRHVVSPLCWVFWGVPDAAELAIDQLQQKVQIRDQTRLIASEPNDRAATSEHTSQPMSVPVYATDEEAQNSTGIPFSPQQSMLLDDIRASDSLTFDTTILPGHTRAKLILTRTHMALQPVKREAFSKPYSSLIEIRKINVESDSNQQTSSTDSNKMSVVSHLGKWLEREYDVQLMPDGLGFVFLQEDSQESVANHLSDLQSHQVTSQTEKYASAASDTADNGEPERTFESKPVNAIDIPRGSESDNTNRLHKTEISLVLNRGDRDKIFTVIMAWSGLKWQPLYSMNRQNRLGNRKNAAEGNSNLDDAIKKALS